MRLQSLFRRDNSIEGEARLDELRYVVFDTEFTSLDQRTNRLLSIGAIAMHGPKILVGDQFYRVTNPQVALPRQSVVVHRLRQEDVSQADPPQVALAKFLSFAEGAVLVGHFVHYDIDIVKKELRPAPAESSHISSAQVDTAKVHRWLEMHRRHYPVEAFDERTIRTDLASVATHYGVEVDEAHQALADAWVTAQVWQKQIAVLANRGVMTWGRLRRM